MITCKEHLNSSQNILAACDSEVLGSVIEEKDFEIKINSSFYGGKKVTEEEFVELLEEYENINLVGNKVVEVALKQGKVRAYKEIKGIKFAMVFKV